MRPGGFKEYNENGKKKRYAWERWASTRVDMSGFDWQYEHALALISLNQAPDALLRISSEGFLRPLLIEAKTTTTARLVKAYQQEDRKLAGPRDKKRAPLMTTTQRPFRIISARHTSPCLARKKPKEGLYSLLPSTDKRMLTNGNG